MGLRFLAFLILMGLLIYFLGRFIQNKRIQADEKKQIESRAMLQCEHCGTYVPKADAIELDGRHYCCQDHLPSRSEADE